MRCFLALLLACAVMPAVQAQESSNPDLIRRLERQLRQLDARYRLRSPTEARLGERLFFDYGGSARFSVLGVDDNFSNTRLLRQTEASLFLRGDLDGAHRFFTELRFTYNDFNGGESFDGDGDELEEPIAQRYWYAFDLRRHHQAATGERLDYNVLVKGGRQLVHWGSGLSLSKILYAGLLDVEIGSLGFTGLASLTPRTGTVDFDGSRPSFDTNTERAFFGVELSYRGNPIVRPYVSYLVQRDKNERNFQFVMPAFTIFPTRFDYDSEYIAVGTTGAFGDRVLYRAEVVHERGRGLSRPFAGAPAVPIPQTREDIRAWAGIVTVGYMPGDERRSRVELEVIAGTGDKDRLDSSDTFGGNAPGTDDRAFNSLGYANTGLVLAPDVSNLLTTQLSYSTSVAASGGRADALRLRLAGFAFTKIKENSPINIPTTRHHFVGAEVDATADWRILSDLSVQLSYGIFFAGNAMPSNQDDPRHFGFVGVSYVF